MAAPCGPPTRDAATTLHWRSCTSCRPPSHRRSPAARDRTNRSCCASHRSGRMRPCARRGVTSSRRNERARRRAMPATGRSAWGPSPSTRRGTRRSPAARLRRRSAGAPRPARRRRALVHRTAGRCGTSGRPRGECRPLRADSSTARRRVPSWCPRRRTSSAAAPRPWGDRWFPMCTRDWVVV